MQNARSVAFILVVLCLGMGSLFAQLNSTGTLAGTVLDSSGAVVPGADVKITSKETGLTRDVKTGAEGQFRFDLLPTGTYEVRATLPGFAAAVYNR